jgi:nucleoid DNA-binding protein
MNEKDVITNKDDFIRQIARRNNYNQGDCRKVVDTIIDILREHIIDRKEFSVRGFGQLKFTTTKAHWGNKPTKGVKGAKEKIWIPETETVKFVLSTDSRNIVKNGYEENSEDESSN